MSAHTASPVPHATALVRALTLTYGVLVYVFFLAVFVSMIGFVGGFGLPRTLDAGRATGSLLGAIAVNVGLLALFAIQHTIMARISFKRWWTRFVPQPIERSTFVLFTSLILTALVVFWQPLPAIVWQVENPVGVMVLWAGFALGWAIVLVSTFIIDHFDLFGLKQTVLFGLGRPCSPPHFEERLIYRYVRHPLMLGFLIAFWSVPVMTQGHLLFSVVTTVYILLAIQIEERTLISLHGEHYQSYRRRVSMLVPRPPRSL